MPCAIRVAGRVIFCLGTVIGAFAPACKSLPGTAGDAGPAVATAPDAAEPSSSAGLAVNAPNAPDAANATDLAPDAASAPGASSEARTPVVHPSGPAAAGNACAPKDAKDATACAPGGFEELACAAGVWKVSQTCRGPGGCKADASGVHCDPGTPKAGDACPAAAASHCSNVHTVFICKSGAWESSLCVPPSKCVPNAKNGVAGCK